MGKKRVTHSVDSATIAENTSGGEMKERRVFAETLNRLMEEKGIDQEKMASDLGMSSGAISNYRNGRVDPKLTSLVKMAKYLDVDCHFLMTGVCSQSALTADDLGLSNGAIKALQSFRDSHPLIDVYNYLIESGNLLGRISAYLSCFALSYLNTPPYKYIPKHGYSYFEDVHFAATIRALQSCQKDFEEKYAKDPRFIKETVYSYLSKHANYEECRQITKEDPDCYEEHYEPTEDEWDEYFNNLREDHSQDIQKYQQELDEQFEAVSDFLAYVKRKKP